MWALSKTRLDVLEAHDSGVDINAKCVRGLDETTSKDIIWFSEAGASIGRERNVSYRRGCVEDVRVWESSVGAACRPQPPHWCGSFF